MATAIGRANRDSNPTDLLAPIHAQHARRLGRDCRFIVFVVGSYTVDETAKTKTIHIDRCTFPQWDEIDATDNIAMPTENELIVTTTKPIPDPTMGAFVPHIKF